MTYDNESCNQFVEDMQNAGLEVEHYNGRFFWEGPAVRCDSRQEVIGATEVSCQWDNMGLGWIVYPHASGKLLNGSPAEV